MFLRLAASSDALIEVFRPGTWDGQEGRRPPAEPAGRLQLLTVTGLDGDPLMAGQHDRSLWPEQKRRLTEAILADAGCTTEEIESLIETGTAR